MPVARKGGGGWLEHGEINLVVGLGRPVGWFHGLEDRMRLTGHLGETGVDGWMMCG